MIGENSHVGGNVAQVDVGVTCAGAARTVLFAKDWQFEIDRPWQKKTNESHGFGAQSGYELTHVGRLRKSGAQLFDVAETADVFEALFWFLSFCCGANAMLFDFRGIDANGALSCQFHREYRVSRNPTMFYYSIAHIAVALDRTGIRGVLLQAFETTNIVGALKRHVAAPNLGSTRQAAQGPSTTYFYSTKPTIRRGTT